MPIDDRTPSRIWDPGTINDIQEKRAWAAIVFGRFPTARGLPNLEDLTFVPAGLTRVPLEGYREQCDTSVTLGGRFAKNHCN
jgi:hypothetical protein